MGDIEEELSKVFRDEALAFKRDELIRALKPSLGPRKARTVPRRIAECEFSTYARFQGRSEQDIRYGLRKNPPGGYRIFNTVIRPIISEKRLTQLEQTVLADLNGIREEAGIVKREAMARGDHRSYARDDPMEVAIATVVAEPFQRIYQLYLSHKLPSVDGKLPSPSEAKRGYVAFKDRVEESGARPWNAYDMLEWLMQIRDALAEFATPAEKPLQ